MRCNQETHFWKQISRTWARAHNDCSSCTCFVDLPFVGQAAIFEVATPINQNHIVDGSLDNTSQSQPLDHFSTAQAKALRDWNDCPSQRAGSASEPGPFKCTWCDSRFNKRCDWERHEQCKYPQKGYVCRQCPAANPNIFKQKQQLESHLRSQHPDEGRDDLEQYQFAIDRGPDAKYMCEQVWSDDFETRCNASFKTWDRRCEHIKHYHHNLDNAKRKRGNGSDDADGSAGPDGGPGRTGESGGKDQPKRQPKRKKRFNNGDAASSASGSQAQPYHDAAERPAGDAEDTPDDTPDEEPGSVTPDSSPREMRSLTSTHTLALRTRTNPHSSPTVGAVGKASHDCSAKSRATQAFMVDTKSTLGLVAAILSPGPCTMFSGRSDCSTPRSTNTGYEQCPKLSLASHASSTVDSHGFFAAYVCRYESIQLRLIKATPATERIQTRKLSMRDTLYEIDSHLPPYSSVGLSEVVNVCVYPDGNPMWGDLETLLVTASRGVISESIGMD